MELSSFIKTHHEQILAAWEEDASGRTPREEHPRFAPLRDHLSELLEAIAVDLDAADRAEHSAAEQQSERNAWAHVAAVAERHGAGRAHQGISLKQMVPEFPALRSCVTRLWRASLSSAQSQELDDLIRFDEAIDFALTLSVEEFTDRLNRARETFLGILSHDLRDPIATIITGARLMLEEGMDQAKMRDVAGRIATTGERMHQLVIDLVDFTRTRLSGRMPIDPHETDIGEVVRHAVDEFSAAHPDRALHIRVSGELRGNWDDKRISQAVNNLLGNALHHGAADTPIDVSAAGSDDEIAVAVHNEGAPIPDERRGHLFEPLTGASSRETSDRDPDHMGLGLYITKAIVSAHGGTIDFDSSEERGTTFTLHLPRAS